LPARTPAARLATLDDRTVRVGGDYVLYWMTTARRTRWSFPLQHAIQRALALDKPLVVVEALPRDRGASPRQARFVAEGMLDNAARFASTPIVYHPWIERGDERGFLTTIAERACLVVVDDDALGPELVPARIELVEHAGIIPLQLVGREFSSVARFRRWVQREIGPLLEVWPVADPLVGATELRPGSLPVAVTERWPMISERSFTIALDGSGGARTAELMLERFVGERLARFDEDRPDPDRLVTSGLSPWLRWGHIAAHEIVARIFAAEGWSSDRLVLAAHGAKHGWWGVGRGAESFLDEVVVWRELALGTAYQRPHDYATYDALPAWARATLARHRRDRRPALQSLATLEAGATDDRLWDAAQAELRATGRIHPAVRRVWSKQIIQMTSSPEEAFERVSVLNDRWALDAGDPLGAAGVAWTFGRYDRPWHRARPVVGTVREMTTGDLLARFPCRDYLARWGTR